MMGEGGNDGESGNNILLDSESPTISQILPVLVQYCCGVLIPTHDYGNYTTAQCAAAW